MEKHTPSQILTASFTMAKMAAAQTPEEKAPTKPVSKPPHKPIHKPVPKTPEVSALDGMSKAMQTVREATDSPYRVRTPSGTAGARG